MPEIDTNLKNCQFGTRSNWKIFSKNRKKIHNPKFINLATYQLDSTMDSFTTWMHLPRKIFFGNFWINFEPNSSSFWRKNARKYSFFSFRDFLTKFGRYLIVLDQKYRKIVTWNIIFRCFHSKCGYFTGVFDVNTCKMFSNSEICSLMFADVRSIHLSLILFDVN